MAAEIWRTKCSHCGAAVPVTDATPSRDEPDGSTSYVAVCGKCGGKATYRRAAGTSLRRSWRMVPLAAALVLGLAGGTAGFVAGIGGGFAMGYASKPETPKKVKPAITYTRSQFDDLVDKKTPDEVIAAVGKPDRTTDTGAWTYYGITFDPAAKQMDTSVEIQFDNNAFKQTCCRVRFR